MKSNRHALLGVLLATLLLVIGCWVVYFAKPVWDNVSATVGVATALAGWLLLVWKVLSPTPVGRQLSTRFSRFSKRSWTGKYPGGSATLHRPSLQAFVEVAREVRAGDGPAVLHIFGDPGMGKSYMLEEFLAISEFQHSFSDKHHFGKESCFSLLTRALAGVLTKSSPFDNKREDPAQLAYDVPDDSLICLDQVDLLSDDFVRGLNAFVTKLKERKRRVLIVTASQSHERAMSVGAREVHIKEYESQTLALIARSVNAAVPPTAIPELLKRAGGVPKKVAMFAADEKMVVAAVGKRPMRFADVFARHFAHQGRAKVLFEMAALMQVSSDPPSVLVEAVRQSSDSKQMRRLEILQLLAPQGPPMHELVREEVIRAASDEALCSAHHRLLSLIEQHPSPDVELLFTGVRHAVKTGDPQCAARYYERHRDRLLNMYLSMSSLEVMIEIKDFLLNSGLDVPIELAAEIGFSQAQQGRYEEARSTLVLARPQMADLATLSNTSQSSVLELRIQVYYAFVLHCFGDFRTALLLCQDVERQKDALQLEEDVYWGAVALAGHCLAHLGDFASSLVKLTSVIDAQRTETLPYRRALSWRSWLNRAAGNYDQAVIDGEEAVACAERTRDNVVLGVAKWSLATVERIRAWQEPGSSVERDSHLNRARILCESARKALRGFAERSAVHILHERIEIERLADKQDDVSHFLGEAEAYSLHKGTNLADNDFKLHLQLVALERRRMCKAPVTAAQYEPLLAEFERNGSRWAWLSARSCQLQCQIALPGISHEEAERVRSELERECEARGWAQELAVLKSPAFANAGSFHPLFFM